MSDTVQPFEHNERIIEMGTYSPCDVGISFSLVELVMFLLLKTHCAMNIDFQFNILRFHALLNIGGTINNFKRFTVQLLLEYVRFFVLTLLESSKRIE